MLRTDESLESAKLSFYQKLCNTLSTQKHEKLIVLGDFNATTTASEEARLYSLIICTN